MTRKDEIADVFKMLETFKCDNPWYDDVMKVIDVYNECLKALPRPLVIIESTDTTNGYIWQSGTTGND